MIEELVRTGIARFEYRHIVNHGSSSVLAALATECAGDQGRWWDFHDRYMTTRDFTREGALTFAASLALDAEQFTHCLDNQIHLEAIEAQHRHAKEIGASRTPTVHINGQGAAIVADALIEQVLELADQLAEEEG